MQFCILIIFSLFQVMGKHLIYHRPLKVKDAIKGNCPKAVTLLALQPTLPTKSTVDIRLDHLLPWDGTTYLPAGAHHLLPSQPTC